MNTQSLTAVLILLPFVTAFVAFASNLTFRRAVLGGMAMVLAISSLLLLAGGPFSFEPAPLFADWHVLLSWADFVLLGAILCVGLFYRHKLAVILVFAQLVPLILIKTASESVPYHSSLAGDRLSLMLVVIVCVVGSLIVLYATEYMRSHAARHETGIFRQGVFFFFLVLFLGAMNGLVLSNNLLWMFFFWELTTLCSFVLISHDQSDQATSNALKALWMNLLGGASFIWAIYLVYINGLPLELSSLTAHGSSQALMLPAALLCLAGLTKSAQLPFQSWLTGAMVAPAPVSALLHSSTMVNAGVFLILKLSPIYQGTYLAVYLAVMGALTFLGTSVLAMSQSNAKRILAYSTIGSLGLVIACAGIGNPQAYSAAMLLILFHALAKGLLFMGVGHIEQVIRSKSIEDMWGLAERFPRTALLMIFGMISMFLPPFGALISKWMTVHAAADLPLIVLMVALGSAFTVIYWTRWAGLMINFSGRDASSEEHNTSSFIMLPLAGLALLGVLLSLMVMLVYMGIAAPAAHAVFPAQLSAAAGSLLAQAGAFAVYPVLLAAGTTLLLIFYRYSSRIKFVQERPYYSGLDRKGQDIPGFTDPLGNYIQFSSSNYYFTKYVPEEKVSMAVNAVAIGVIILILAVSL